jgi:biopolymer transport protein ExbD
MRHHTKRNRLRPSNSLILTSLMDILTVLVLFLLKSFVMEGEAVTPVPGVALPQSSSQTAAQSAIVIAIFNDTVMLNGEVVATVSKSVASADLLIAPLAKRLDETRAQATQIAHLRGAGNDFDGKVSIQGDREINFAILQRVMYTCSASGYDHISLAVIASS